MDIKDIIKWFIPCFHMLLYKMNKMNFRLTLYLFLLFLCPSFAGKVYRSDVALSSASYITNNTKNLELFDKYEDQSRHVRIHPETRNYKALGDTSVGRTFGIRFKKMIQAFIPLAFQLGAAATWATVAALVGVKTLAVTLLILKLLLLAGAVKVGAFFASATKNHHQELSPHQKEIHLHIHNGAGGYHTGDEDSVISPWSRESQVQPATGPAKGPTQHLNVVLDPYAGPQTISTPYGHYMKIDPGPHHVTQ